MFSSIVVRLRLLLLVVGLVTVTASLSGLTQLREISNANGALNESALPILMKTQTVERKLSDLFVVVERATFATDVAQLSLAETELEENIRSFRQHVVDVAQARGHTQLADRVLADLDKLEISVRHLLDRKTAVFDKQRRMDALREDLTAIGTEARAALRVLRSDVTLHIDALLSEARSGRVPRADMLDRLFSDLFVASLTLNSLSMDIDVVVDLAGLDHNAQTITAYERLRTTHESKLKRVADLLEELETSPQRTTLTALALRLEELLLGPEGLIAIGQDRLVHQAELFALREVRAEMSRDISVFINDLTENAKADVARKSKSLNDATHLLSLILIFCMFLAATIIMIGNAIIIEKQINRRMGRLSDAVQAIAGGNLTHPIDISGPDELGDIAHALSIFKQNAEELRRSNVDLERFAYVAAHDLRAPLRAVHDLAEWTMEDTENVLSDNSNTYLELMQRRVERLDRLLTDLLDYACAGRQDDGLASVRLPQLIEQISNMLKRPDGFEIHFNGPDIPVRTYATPLTQILINLLTNAIKHHDRDAGRITVSAKLAEDRLLIEVADDGPGIPCEYHDRIYQLFQTLRPRDEVEGSGLGLAIIRKLLDRYKGTISLDSDPENGRGARFRFDLPAEEIAQDAVGEQADAA